MSRYIDAEWLKANCDIMVGNTTIGRRDYVMFHEIDSAPSIDIVTCKECKHWQMDWTSEEGVDDYHYCPMVDRSTFADWFCADGERREP